MVLDFDDSMKMKESTSFPATSGWLKMSNVTNRETKRQGISCSAYSAIHIDPEALDDIDNPETTMRVCAMWILQRRTNRIVAFWNSAATPTLVVQKSCLLRRSKGQISYYSDCTYQCSLDHLLFGCWCVCIVQSPFLYTLPRGTGMWDSHRLYFQWPSHPLLVCNCVSSGLCVYANGKNRFPAPVSCSPKCAKPLKDNASLQQHLQVPNMDKQCSF